MFSVGAWVLLRGNRHGQVVPVLTTIALWTLEGLSPLFGSLMVAWGIVWVAGRWLPGRQPAAAGLPGA